MRTITKEVYTFAELPESAKETARDKHREHNLEGFDWWDSVYDDAKDIGALFGLRIVRIYFSGFWSQGDGAHFIGGYPMYIVCNDGGVLCPTCAKDNYAEIAHDTVKGWKTGWDVMGADINWEDSDLYCDHCNERIESAYGEES